MCVVFYVVQATFLKGGGLLQAELFQARTKSNRLESKLQRADAGGIHHIHCMLATLRRELLAHIHAVMSQRHAWPFPSSDTSGAMLAAMLEDRQST